MEKFNKIISDGVVLNIENIDTDQIIPARFLVSTTKSGYADALFHDWRYTSDHNLNSEFLLNKPQHKNAKILITAKNFGCGSSREHAAWALKDYGFKVIIAPSYSDIFNMNALKNGLLAITFDQSVVEEIMNQAIDEKVANIEVDLEKQVVIINGKVYSFSIDQFRRLCMINGYDDLQYMLSKQNEIANYEARYIK